MATIHTYLITHAHTTPRLDIQRPTVSVRAETEEQARAQRRKDILDHAERRRLAPGSAVVGVALTFTVCHDDSLCACQSKRHMTADELY